MFALYEATYRSDWRKLTPSVFLSRIEQASRISASVNGFYTDENVREADVAKKNREILIKRRFPLNFPEVDNV